MEEIVLQIPFSCENLRIIASYLKTYDNNKYYPLFHQYAMKHVPFYNVKEIHQIWIDSTILIGGVRYMVLTDQQVLQDLKAMIKKAEPVVPIVAPAMPVAVQTTPAVSPVVPTVAQAMPAVAQATPTVSGLNIINLKAMIDAGLLITIQDNKQVYVNEENALTVFQILLFEKRWSQAFKIFKNHELNKKDLIAQVKETPESIKFLHESGIDNETVCLLNLAYGKEPFLKREPEESFKKPQKGDIVVRGPDWKWSDQDGGSGNYGVIIQNVVSDKKFDVEVQWSNIGQYFYRMRKDAQDLRIIARRIDNKNLQIGDYVRQNGNVVHRIAQIEGDFVITEAKCKFLKTDIKDVARACESTGESASVSTSTSDSMCKIDLFHKISYSKVFETLPEFFPCLFEVSTIGIVTISNIGVALMAKNKWMLEYLFKNCDDRINWNGLNTLAFDAEYVKAVKELAVSDEQRWRLDKIKVLSSYKNPVVDTATLETAIKSL